MVWENIQQILDVIYGKNEVVSCKMVWENIQQILDVISGKNEVVEGERVWCKGTCVPITNGNDAVTPSAFYSPRSNGIGNLPPGARTSRDYLLATFSKSFFSKNWIELQRCWCENLLGGGNVLVVGFYFCLSVCPSIGPSVRVFICALLHLSVCRFVGSSVPLSIRLAIHPSFRLPTCPSNQLPTQ